MPKVAYRYDTRDHSLGDVIDQKDDHIVRLTDHQKRVELALRAAMPDGDRIRSTSLYLWEDRELAEKLWRLNKQPVHLYEVRIDVDDFVHRGDLNYYSAAADTVAVSISAFDFAIKQYWAGINHPRIEILVKRATVVKKLFDATEK